MPIREALDADFDAIWPIFRAIVSKGDAYAYPVDTGKAEAHRLWMQLPRKTFVVEEAGRILGTYYLKTNQRGGGAHVCNCGYITAPGSAGRGVARAMLDHSLIEAKALGFQAMQYNFVLETNQRALSIWTRAGFNQIGRIPRAFRLPDGNYTDALIFHKFL